MCPTDKVVERSIELDILAFREDDCAILDDVASTSMRNFHSTKVESSLEKHAPQRRASMMSHRRSGSSFRIRTGPRATSTERRGQRHSKGRTRSLRTSSFGLTVSLANTSIAAPGEESETLGDITEMPIGEDGSFEMPIFEELGQEPLADLVGELPECIVVVTRSEMMCSDSLNKKQCKFCAKVYKGFGDACSTCRKTCGRGVQQCRLCGDYFQGFVDTCEACSAC